jgi:hypothetical protein
LEPTQNHSFPTRRNCWRKVFHASFPPLHFFRQELYSLFFTYYICQKTIFFLNREKWFLEIFTYQKWEILKKKLPDSYMWFSLRSQTYRKMIKDLYFLFLVYSQTWLNLPRDECHRSYNQKFLQRTLEFCIKLRPGSYG